MATKLYYDGKVAKIPDIYTRIKSGIVNPPLSLDYGVVLVVDTGSMAEWGSGSGILGANRQNLASIVKDIDTPQLMRDYVKGGKWYGLTEPLFRPFGSVKGVSRMIFVRAAETTAGEITYTFTGGGSNGGTIKFTTLDEGVVVNGQDSVGHLSKGYGALMQAAQTAGKFVIKLFIGTFTGLDSQGNPYDGVQEVDTVPKLLIESPEFDNMSQLQVWVANSKELASMFKVAITVNGTGAVDAADLAANASLNKATGGTETYSSAAFTAALESITELQYNFIFMDKYGSDATASTNTELQYHIDNDSKFGRIGFVAAYDEEADFDSSLSIASTFNDENIVVVHGGTKVANPKSVTGFDTHDAMFTAAITLGRVAGLAPQIPLTFKLVGVDGVVHELKKNQKESSLDGGVLVVYKDEEFNGFAVLQDVNSLQQNDYLVNGDATSHSMQLVRIKHQINFEIYMNAKKSLFGDPNGVNRNTLSEASVKNFIESYLKSKLATPDEDNLILEYQNVTVERDGDIYKAQYEFKPNTEITKMLITGVIID